MDIREMLEKCKDRHEVLQGEINKLWQDLYMDIKCRFTRRKRLWRIHRSRRMKYRW